MSKWHQPDETVGTAMNNTYLLEGLSAFEADDSQAWLQHKETALGTVGVIVRFAERWACLLQEEIKAGRDLKSIARVCAEDADTMRVVMLFEYYLEIAVEVLEKFWTRGRDLREWYDRHYLS